MFATSGKIDNSRLKEFLSVSVTWKVKAVFAAMLLFELYFVFFTWQRGDMVFFGLGLLTLALTAFIVMRMLDGVRILTLQKMRELGVDALSYTTSFGDQTVKVVNHSTKTTEEIPYLLLIRFVETEHFFLMKSKDGQWVPVFKDRLTPQKQEDFKKFVKSLPTQIRW
jgi:hypothetical protein